MLRHQYTWLPRVGDTREPILANDTLEWGGPNIRISSPVIPIPFAFTQVRVVATSSDPTVVVRLTDANHTILLDNLVVPVNATVNAPIATNSVIVSAMSPLDASTVAYTVTAIQSTAQQVDDWGNPIQTIASPPAPAPTPGKPCLFRDMSTVDYTQNGPVQVETNSIAIPWNDTLRIGDWIGDITDPVTATHFIDQPARVEMIADYAPHGELIYRIARLRFGEAE